MARQRSPNRDKAFEIYKASNGEKALVEIAKELNLKPSQIRKWKSQDKWDEQLKGNVTIAKRSITNVKNPETKAKLKKMLDDEELTEQDHMLKDINILGKHATSGWTGTGILIEATKQMSYNDNVKCNNITITNMKKGIHLRVDPKITKEADMAWVNAKFFHQITFMNFEYGLYLDCHPNYVMWIYRLIRVLR